MTGWVAIVAAYRGLFASMRQLSPLTTREARTLGIQRWHLRSREWQRVGPGVYASAARLDNTMVRLEAAACRLPAVAAFAGLSSAWLLGVDVDVSGPIEAIVPKGNRVSGRSGMRIYRSRPPEDEVTVAHGFRTTNILRTLEGIARRLSLVEATAVIDAALRAGLTDLNTFQRWVRTRRGGRGLINLRHAAASAEPKSESPMETRLRMLLVLGGLPRPEAQVPIYDGNGQLVGPPDLYFPEHRLGIEYDGGSHRESLAEDNRRQNRLLEAGVALLRFTAADVLNRPATVVAQVRGMCASAGTRAKREGAPRGAPSLRSC